MLKVALVLVLFSLPQDQKVTELAFIPEQPAEQKILEKCAAQMRRRIVDYGYKGVVVLPTETGIKVAFDPGIPPAMALAIERLATVKGEAFMWAWLPMTDKELEQWIPGKTSPPGTTWLIDEEVKTIMDNSWKLPMDVRFERYQADGNVEMKRLSFSKVDSKRFLERYAKEKTSRNFALIVDGKRFPVAGMFTERTVFDKAKGERVTLGILDWIPSAQPSDEVTIKMIGIGNPLPAALVKAK